MQSSEEEIDSEICYYHTEKSKDTEPMEEHRPAECLQRITVKSKRIYQKGNQSPDFFRIPGPIASP